MNEFKKRLDILNSLFSCFDKSKFEGILLTGSMAHGTFFNIHKESDIDLIFIIKKTNINLIKKDNFFINSEFYCEEKLELLRKNILFWCDQKINSVKINMGFCTTDCFKEFCNLKAKKWQESKEHQKIKSMYIKTIDGAIVEEKINIKKHTKLYIRSYENYKNGRLLARPFFSNLINSKILYDPNGLLKYNLEFLEKNLVKRYGVTKVLNLLDFVFNKASEKYKQEIISKLNN